MQIGPAVFSYLADKETKKSIENNTPSPIVSGAGNYKLWLSLLVRYLYCEHLELTEDNIFAVLYAAKKYLVTSLTRRCVTYLESILSPENVCMFLENVFLFEDEYPALRQRCFQVMHVCNQLP